MCIWSVSQGELLSQLEHHTEPVTCCAWLPSGPRGYSDQLVTGGQDKKLALVYVYGRVVRTWEVPRVQEVVVAKNGRYMLVR